MDFSDSQKMSELIFEARLLRNQIKDERIKPERIKNELSGTLDEHTEALNKYNTISAANAFLTYLSFTKLSNKDKEKLFRERFGEAFNIDEDFQREVYKAEQSCYTGEIQNLKIH